METRVLIVEDEPRWAEQVESCLSGIAPGLLSARGIDRIFFTRAASKESAVRALAEAAEAQKPFEVLCLDLGLPPHDGEPDPGHPHCGLAVLDYVRSRGGASSVIVLSKLEDPALIVSAYSGGVVKYLFKSDDERAMESLRNMFIWCCDSLLEAQTQKVLRNRERELTAWAERALRDHLVGRFVRTAESLLFEFQRLESDLRTAPIGREKLHLDILLGMRRRCFDSTIAEYRAECSGTGAGEDAAGAEPSRVMLEGMLVCLISTNRPCFLSRRTEVTSPPSGETALVSYGGDLAVIMSELLLGGISERPAVSGGGSAGNIVVSIEKAAKDGPVNVLVKDNLTRIPQDTAEALNRGVAPPDAAPFSRAWGLHVVQHLAQCRGGGIKVGYDEATASNLVAFQTPV